MKIPERRAGQNQTRPDSAQERGKSTELSPLLRTNCCLPAKLKQFTLPDCPLLFTLSLSPFQHFSFFIWNIFRIRCNWRINFVWFDASMKKKILKSLQVACHNCPTISFCLFGCLSFSLPLCLSGTGAICISIFEQLNINESPHQLQIAVARRL